MSVKEEKLGRFGHHPDPAVDFCVEVDMIEGLVADVKAKTQEYEPVADIVFRAMQFTVGGDLRAIAAKQALRDAEAALKRLAPGPQAVKRWALWSPTFGFFKRFPHDGEELYESQRSAEAARLSGSHYAYKPVQVRIVPILPGGK